MVQTYLILEAVFGFILGVAVVGRNWKLMWMMVSSVIISALFSLLYIPVYRSFGVAFTTNSFIQFITPVFMERTLIALSAVYFYAITPKLFKTHFSSGGELNAGHT